MYIREDVVIAVQKVRIDPKVQSSTKPVTHDRAGMPRVEPLVNSATRALIRATRDSIAALCQ